MTGKTGRQNSGQILVLSVLVVSLVLLSTQLYILEVSRSLESVEATSPNNFALAARLGSKHVVTGSLANISMGGDNSTLLTNLEKWVTFSGQLYQFGRTAISFAPWDQGPYSDGLHLGWGQSGFGVSSSRVDFNLSIQDYEVDAQLAYTVNVTTWIAEEAFYRTIQGDLKQVTVTCRIFNENDPALAHNVTILFEHSGDWIRADTQANYSLTNFGNGTYLASFDAEIPQVNVNVSAQVCDSRGIYVRANATCTAVP